MVRNKRKKTDYVHPRKGIEKEDGIKEGNKENKKKKRENTSKREHMSNISANVLEEKKENKCKILKVCAQTCINTRGDREKKMNKDREGDEEMEAGCSKDIGKSLTPATVATATEMVTDPQELNVIPSTEGSEDINLGNMEDDGMEDDKVPDVTSPPTPSKPRMRTDGSTPPKRHSLVIEMNDQENDADILD